MEAPAVRRPQEPPRPLRVAVVAGPDPGHAFPAAALALRLTAAGHAARLYTGERFAARMAADGIDVHLLPLLAAPPGDDDRDFGHRLHARAGQMAPPLAALLGGFGPALVVSDVLTVAGGLAAELAGVPWVELVPHLLHVPSAALPPPGTGLAPGRGVAGRSRDAALRRFHARALSAGDRQRAAVRAGLGLPAADPGPARRMVATLPGLEYPRPDWPVGTAIVGPLLWDPADDDLAPPPGDGPLVVVSGSTSVNGRVGLLPAALAGLGGQYAARLDGARLDGTRFDGAAVGVAAGAAGAAGRGAGAGLRLAGTVLEEYAGAVPPWAAVGRGRQGPLLAAAAVAVTGGGHGMVAKALACGVPVVVAPGGGDQRDVAHRVIRSGAGVVLRRLSPGAVAAAVRAVLADPGYRAAARRLAAEPPPADPVRVCEEA